MTFEISEQPVDKISVEAAIVFAMAGSKKKDSYVPLESFTALDAKLSGQLKTTCDIKQFSGKRGEFMDIILAQNTVPGRVIVVGLGRKDAFIADDLRRALGKAAGALKYAINAAAVAVPQDLGLEASDGTGILCQAMCEGFLLGVYDFNKYKEKKENTHVFSTVIFSEKSDPAKKAIHAACRLAEISAKATNMTRDLINEQSSVKTPGYLAELAEEIAKSSTRITVTVFDKSELQKIGMGAFLAIAKGADTPAKFIHLEYTPANAKSKKKAVLIGKGITFDSGGISLKPADAMTTMKCDMSGAAAVLGVFSVIEEIRPDFAVMGLIAATANLVSGSSTVPGDVAKAYNGKTIEILNTDAEGRVTLADSLSYAVQKGGTHLIDLATLTGACMVALGTDIAGLYANNRSLAEEVKSSAFDAGEKMWEMPLEADYKQLNKSEVADIANIASTRYGGSITAALFLSEFVSDKPWVHIDIAGPAFLTHASDIGPKGATGFGVRTLINYLTKKY